MKFLAATEDGFDVELFHLPPETLDLYLAKFFIGARQSDGSEYEPDTLTTYQRGIDRYLTEHGYKFSICRDTVFKKSQDAIRAKRSDLKGKGKGNKTRASEPLTDDEIRLMREKGVLGNHSPESLLFTVWWNNTKLLGFRASDENKKLLWGDIKLKATATGREYVEFNERDNKTRSGQYAINRPYSPKMFAVDDKSICPIETYKLYRDHRPLEMCSDDSRFYLAINYKPIAHIWYKRQPMGRNKLESIMQIMAEKAGIPGRKTNHSARKTAIQKLNDCGIPPTQIMQLSGHRNVQSINSYAVNSLPQQELMSDILVGQNAGQLIPASSQQRMPSSSVRPGYSASSPSTESLPRLPPSLSDQSISGQMEQQHPLAAAAAGMFTGATMTGCTVKVTINVAGTSGFMSQPPRRRRAVIYDTSDSSQD